MRQDRWFLFVAIGAWVLLALTHLFFIRNMPNFSVPVIDSLDYVRDATNPDAARLPYYHSPLYLWLVKLVLGATGKCLIALRLVQVGIGAGTILLLYAVGVRIFSRAVARVAVVAWVLYGPVLFFSTEILNLGVILFFNLLALLLVLRTWDRPTPPRWALAGLGMGLAATARPDVLVFALLVAAVLLVRRLRPEHLSLGRAALLAGLFLFVTLLPLLMVGARNQRVSGQFAMLPTNGGLNFYIGNNPNYRDTIALRLERWYTLTHMPLAEGVGTEMNELGHGRFYYGKALDFITTSPIEYARCVFYKLRTLVNGYELPETFDVYTYRNHSPVLRLLVWRWGEFYFPFGLLLPLALCGAVLSVRENPRSWWLVLLVLAGLVSLVGYWNSARYRLLITPVLMLWAGFFGVWLWQHLQRREWTPATFALASVTVLGVLTNWPVDHFSKHFDFDAERKMIVGLERMGTEPDEGLRLLHEAAAQAPSNFAVHYNLGDALLKTGRVDEAIAELTRATQLDLGFYPAHDYLGRAYARKGEPAEAIRHFERTLELFPRSYLTHYNLAATLMEEGQPQRARAHLEEVLRINPRYADAHNNLGVLAFEAGDMAAAEVHFAAAAKLNPGHPNAASNLAAVRARQSQAPAGPRPPALPPMHR